MSSTETLVVEHLVRPFGGRVLIFDTQATTIVTVIPVPPQVWQVLSVLEHPFLSQYHPLWEVCRRRLLAICFV